MFKKGDEVKRIKSSWSGMDEGDMGIIEDINSEGSLHLKKFGGWHDKDNFRKVGSMSKYEELKRRIDKVEGWDKDTDDILQEIASNKYSICITARSDRQQEHGSMAQQVEIQTTPRDHVEAFPFDSQCGKNTAFKKALMWLLDNSDIKKDLQAGDIATLEKDGMVYRVKVL